MYTAPNIATLNTATIFTIKVESHSIEGHDLPGMLGWNSSEKPRNARSKATIPTVMALVMLF